MEENMDINISRIKSHVYVKGSLEAVELYMEAFGLEKESEYILDAEGNIWHCVLTRNGEEYMSISEDKYLPEDLLKKYSDEIRPIMLFKVEFEKEDDLKKAFELLSKNGNPCAGLKVEPWSIISCDVIDKFGVFWYLIVWKH
jgi:PhnB protein